MMVGLTLGVEKMSKYYAYIRILQISSRAFEDQEDLKSLGFGMEEVDWSFVKWISSKGNSHVKEDSIDDLFLNSENDLCSLMT